MCRHDPAIYALHILPGRNQATHKIRGVVVTHLFNDDFCKQMRNVLAQKESPVPLIYTKSNVERTTERTQLSQRRISYVIMCAKMRFNAVAMAEVRVSVQSKRQSPTTQYKIMQSDNYIKFYCPDYEFVLKLTIYR